MSVGSRQASVTAVEPGPMDQWAFLQYCWEEAYSSVRLLQQEAISTADLATGEAIELLALAGKLGSEVYGQRLVFVRITKDAEANLIWLTAVRSFIPEQFSLPPSGDMAAFRPVFDPVVLPSVVVREALQESAHTDEVTKRTFWRIITFGQSDSPVFCAGATFLSAEYMLAGLGSLDASGNLHRRILPGRDIAFPDELYIGSEIFPRRWPKPVRALVEGVFGEDRTDEMPLGMRRVALP